MANSIAMKVAKQLANKVSNKLTTGLVNKAFDLAGISHKLGNKKLLPHELQELVDKDASDYSLDLLTGRQYYNGRSIDNMTLTVIRNALSNEHGVRISEADIKKAVGLTCYNNPFHPVRKYLHSLSVWDNHDRIPELFDLLKIKADDDEHRKLIERMLLAFLIACVARVEKPGTKSDSMLILKGGTGFRKSTFLRLLATNDSWFSSALLDITKKDGLQIISQFWIFEIAEMHAFLRKPANAIKEFISRTRDDWRAPYAKTVEAHERQVMFVGSTNQEKFLTDPTSTRRFWVVEIGDKIDTDRFISIRDALWAQAFACYTAGQNWYLSSSDEELMADKVANYQK